MSHVPRLIYVLIGLTVLIVVVVAAFWLRTPKTGKQNLGSQATPDNLVVVDPSGLPCQNNPNPVFSSHLTDLQLVDQILPPSYLEEEDIIKSHSFIWQPTFGQVRAEKRMPVYAPVDSTFYTGGAYQHQGINDYVLFFEASCEVYYLLDHVEEPVNKIKQVLAASPTDTAAGYVPVQSPIQFRAGDLIGYTSASSWDFGVYNRAKPNLLFGQETYKQAKVFTRDAIADCPYDYFTDDLKAQYTRLFAPPDKTYNTQLLCQQ